MKEEEKKEKNKDKSKLIIIILVILLLLLMGVLIYILFIKKPATKVDDNNTTENINEQTGINVDKVSKELVELISDFDGVMLLQVKGDKPASYTVKDLTKENYSNIILAYALQNIGEKDNDICKYDKDYNSVCYIKVSELNTKLGLNIGSNIKTNEYVKGIEKINNEDYYKVVFPATEYSPNYYVRDCTSSNSDDTLTIKCDVYEVIEMYDPYEEAKIGIGEFVYNVKDKLSFEKFKFTASSTSTTKKDDNQIQETATRKITKIELTDANSEQEVTLNSKKVKIKKVNKDSGYVLYINGVEANIDDYKWTEIYSTGKVLLLGGTDICGTIFNYAINDSGKIITVTKEYSEANGDNGGEYYLDESSIKIENGKVVAEIGHVGDCRCESPDDYCEKNYKGKEKVEFVYNNEKVIIKKTS